MERTRDGEERQPPIPLAEEPLGQLAIADLPLGHRVGIDPVECDHLLQAALQRRLHLLVRPLERERAGAERDGERVEHPRSLVHAVRLADEQQPRLSQGRGR